MRLRFMRLIVMFDLHMETSAQIRSYNKFHKFLICEGFMMFQRSVYVKLCLDSSILESSKNKINQNLPKDGCVSVLAITEKQFSKMELFGNYDHDDLIQNTEELLVI